MANLQNTFPGAVALTAVLLAAFAFPSAHAQSGRGTPALTKAPWAEDVRYFARELPKRHKNAYHATSREQFARAVSELESAIPSLQHHQIVVRLHQIAASVGDGHTGVHLPLFKRYPLQVYWFGKDRRVIAAAKDYARAPGTRVVKIVDVGIDAVQSKVATCFPSAANENEWYVLNTSPAFIMRPEVLHALGIIPDLASAPFTFADDQGAEFTLEITPIAMPAPAGGVVNMSLLPAAKQQPMYRQKPGRAAPKTTR